MLQNILTDLMTECYVFFPYLLPTLFTDSWMTNELGNSGWDLKVEHSISSQNAVSVNK